MQLGWRAKIGQIRPATSIEGAEEWRAVAPVGVHFADARTVVERVDEQGLEGMMSQVLDASRRLATAKVDLIAQCGAPGTFLVGNDADSKVTEEIQSDTGIPAITMMRSMVDGLKAVGASSLAIGTIYTDAANSKLGEYLEREGFKIASMEGLQMLDPYEPSLHDADSAYRLGRNVFERGSGADAIVISCGAYRTFEMLPYLELDTQVPVVSSNQATLWRALRYLGLRDVIEALGTLGRIQTWQPEGE